MRLYDYLMSGNGYKCRLLLNQLGLKYERIDLDILAGATHTPEYLAKNPNGRIPMLELDDGNCLSESDAILFYLAEGTHFLPSTRLERARVLQWMFFEQYNHEPNIATVRFWIHTGMNPEREMLLPMKRRNGIAALEVMEQHLVGQPFFVGGEYSIADIALYAYTHVGDEGGFDLSPYRAINAWFARVRQQPGHIPIDKA